MWTGDVSAWVTKALSSGLAKVARTTSWSPSRSMLVTWMAKPPVRWWPRYTAMITTTVPLDDVASAATSRNEGGPELIVGTSDGVRARIA